jgi:hypothetical protein
MDAMTLSFVFMAVSNMLLAFALVALFRAFMIGELTTRKNVETIAAVMMDKFEEAMGEAAVSAGLRVAKTLNRFDETEQIAKDVREIKNNMKPPTFGESRN